MSKPPVFWMGLALHGAALVATVLTVITADRMYDVLRQKGHPHG